MGKGEGWRNNSDRSLTRWELDLSVISLTPQLLFYPARSLRWIAAIFWAIADSRSI
ncbi:hypothetical protein [Oscillatoria sp. HE19RPO]|uniref:hypothetical protein n=1 Tax=Oscillatoria sp. HE19RPO TaxID=2954806 RepID=UPI0020C49FA4|nr:hypothetical protein [Oscillatoria sp. HE19RPO]